MSNIHNVCSCAPTGLGSVNGSIDNDPEFIKDVDAAWDAYKLYQKNPSDINIQMLMQTVNTLGVYFKSHVPTQANDPQAFAIYTALTSAGPHSSSLLADCNDYGTAGCQATVQWFQTQEKQGVDEFATLDAGMEPIGNIYDDKGNGDIQKSFDYLKSVISMYNALMQQSDPDPTLVGQLLGDISADIKDLLGKLQNTKDGPLVAIRTFLNTPITADAGAPTLASLTDPAALQKALHTLGEDASSSGGDLMNLLNFVQSHEYA